MSDLRITAGAFEFYCALLDHRDAGMAGTLTIEATAAGSGGTE